MCSEDQYKKKTQGYRYYPQWSSILFYPREQSFKPAKVVAFKFALNGPFFIDAIEHLLQVGLRWSHRQEREEREDTDYESFQVWRLTTRVLNIPSIDDDNAVMAWIALAAKGQGY